MSNNRSHLSRWPSIDCVISSNLLSQEKSPRRRFQLQWFHVWQIRGHSEANRCCFADGQPGWGVSRLHREAQVGELKIFPPTQASKIIFLPADHRQLYQWYSASMTSWLKTPLGNSSRTNWPSTISQSIGFVSASPIWRVRWRSVTRSRARFKATATGKSPRRRRVCPHRQRASSRTVPWTRLWTEAAEAWKIQSKFKRSWVFLT